MYFYGCKINVINEDNATGNMILFILYTTRHKNKRIPFLSFLSFLPFPSLTRSQVLGGC